jgi:hypothetical protein
VVCHQRQQRQSNLERQSFAITQFIIVPKGKTFMSNQSLGVAESQVIKSESQIPKEECDLLFINLKVKQQVFFLHLWIMINTLFHTHAGWCHLAFQNKKARIDEEGGGCLMTVLLSFSITATRSSCLLFVLA